MQPVRKEKASIAVSQLIDFFEEGVKSKGLGLKHLREIYWEIRFNIEDRIIFSVKNDIVSFIITGNYDENKKIRKKYLSCVY